MVYRGLSLSPGGSNVLVLVQPVIILPDGETCGGILVIVGGSAIVLNYICS